jgi:hypothetical protein
MDNSGVVRVPTWTTIVVEQVRLVGMRFRAAGTSLLALGVLVGAAFVWYLRAAGTGAIAIRTIALSNHALSAPARAKLTQPLEPLPFIYSPEICTVIVAIALLLPIAMWQDEPPARRDYHRVMPVGASTHTFLRVLAGWYWMMLLTVLYLVAVVTVPTIVGWMPGALPVSIHYMAWWEWLVPFTAVTIAYLFTSAAAVGARRPLVWVGGFIILYWGLVTLTSMLQMKPAADALLLGYSGFYGFAAAMMGQVAWAAGAPNSMRWLGATVLWGLAGAALLFVVSGRRAEAGA